MFHVRTYTPLAARRKAKKKIEPKIGMSSSSFKVCVIRLL
jgi:hypothetical protein